MLKYFAISLIHRYIIPRLRHGLLSLCSVTSFRRKMMEISVMIFIL